MENLSKEKQIEELAKIMCDRCSAPYCEHREKNIVCDAVYEYAQDLYNAGYRKQSENTIELPCKVGDTVYSVLKSGFIYSAQVVGFHLGIFPTLNGHKRNEYLVCYTNHYLRHIDIAQIGKTVFFTKAEAEAKMKGGEADA